MANQNANEFKLRGRFKPKFNPQYLKPASPNSNKKSKPSHAISSECTRLVDEMHEREDRGRGSGEFLRATGQSRAVGDKSRFNSSVAGQKRAVAPVRAEEIR